MSWARSLPAAAVLAPLVGVIAPKGLAPLLFVLGAWAWLVGWRHVREAAAHPSRLTVIVIGAIALLVLWALISLAWTPDRADAWLSWLNVTAVALSLPPLLLQPTDATVRRALVIGFVLALLAMVGQMLADYAVLRWVAELKGDTFKPAAANRGLIALLLLAWPTACVLAGRGKPWLGAAALAAAMLSVFAGVSNSAQIACVLALLAALAAYALPRAAPVAFAVVFGLAALAAPLAIRALPAPEALQDRVGEQYYSSLHRLYIWDFASRRVGDRPLAGWGFDASPHIPGGDERLPQGGNRMNMHPHNGSLQVWIELGAIGALAWAALLAAVALALRRLPGRLATALAAGQLVAGLTVVHLSFGIWQTAWLAALGLAATLTRAVSPPSPRAR